MCMYVLRYAKRQRKRKSPEIVVKPFNICNEKCLSHSRYMWVFADAYRHIDIYVWVSTRLFLYGLI